MTDPALRAALTGLVTQWKERTRIDPDSLMTIDDYGHGNVLAYRTCADELEALLAGVPEPPTTDTNPIAVQLAELMAAHRDGYDGPDCSDVNDPGSCGKCDVLTNAIKALSGAVPEVAAPGAQGEGEYHALEPLPVAATNEVDVVAIAMSSLESDATHEQRAEAWDLLRDHFFPLVPLPGEGASAKPIEQERDELLHDWREQDSILQQIAAIVGDEDVTDAPGVLTAVKAFALDRQQEIASLRDNNRQVKALFDARVGALPSPLDGWQDISSAPKDGSRFLGGRFHRLYGWTWNGARHYDDGPLESPSYFVMDSGGEPSHHLPLPPPPQRTRDEK